MYFLEFLTNNKSLFEKFSEKWKELKDKTKGVQNNKYEQYYVLTSDDYINGLYNIFYGLIKEAFNGRDDIIPDNKYSVLAIGMEKCAAECSYYMINANDSNKKPLVEAIDKMLKYAYLLNPIRTNINYPNLTTIRLVNSSVTSENIDIDTIINISAAEEREELSRSTHPT